MGVLVRLPCTGRSTESLPYILDMQNYIFLQSWNQGFGMNLKTMYLDQPIMSWSSLSPARFQAHPFQFRAVLRFRKNFLFKANWGSFQSYTIKVSHAGCFTRLSNPLFFVGCTKFVLDNIIRWYFQGHFGILYLDFELCNSFIVINTKNYWQ